MASSLHAALFTNGSFENSMTGWTFSDIDLVLDDTPFSGWEASDGIYSVDLNGFVPGFIEQTFDTVAGETYDVSFDLSGNPGGSSILRTLDVMIDSSTVLSPDYDTVLNGNTENDMMWETHSFSFIADDSSTTLRFESTTAGGFGFPIDAMGPVLDNVSVIASAVPEPAALSLVTMVLLAFILVRRKKLLLS
jgi:choice-of-anchor C domain-containing protein